MFEWNEKLSVGISEIDEQHKKLLEIGRKFVDVLESTASGYDEYDELRKLLANLYNYTEYHFDYEEELMEKAGYADLHSHHIQHEKFKEKISEIDLDELDEDQYIYTMEILDFLSNWIVNHILKIDTQYKPIVLNYLSKEN